MKEFLWQRKLKEQELHIYYQEWLIWQKKTFFEEWLLWFNFWRKIYSTDILPYYYNPWNHYLKWKVSQIDWHLSTHCFSKKKGIRSSLIRTMSKLTEKEATILKSWLRTGLKFNQTSPTSLEKIVSSSHRSSKDHSRVKNRFLTKSENSLSANAKIGDDPYS